MTGQPAPQKPSRDYTVAALDNGLEAAGEVVSRKRRKIDDALDQIIEAQS